jgi:hypothetical protein
VKPPTESTLFRCDRCRTAYAPLTAWPTHPRQGYACCPYCGDVVTKYVRDAAGNWVKADTIK